MHYRTIFLLSVSISFVFQGMAAMPPAPNYCEHQGYNYTDRTCVFSQNESCDAQAFLNGSCGQEFQKEIECREKGEVVFTEFESCCGELEPYLPTGAAGQPSCQEPRTMIQKISGVFRFFTGVLGDILE